MDAGPSPEQLSSFRIAAATLLSTALDRSTPNGCSRCLCSTKSCCVRYHVGGARCANLGCGHLGCGNSCGIRCQSLGTRHAHDCARAATASPISGTALRSECESAFPCNP